MSDTYIDGLGVVADQTLPPGTRIRFVLDPKNRSRDITVLVEKGNVRIYGMNRPLTIKPINVNDIAVTTDPSW